jgi:signal transduction histidine kinase
MGWLPRGLRVRLLLAHLLILGLGVAGFVLLAGLLAPAFLPTLAGPGLGILGGAGAFALLIIVLGELVLAARLARPLGQLAAAARRIGSGHAATRVPGETPEPRDELGDLIRAFNEMAAALEAAEQRRIERLGEVAHELRTPVAILEGYLEGLLDGMVPPTPETWAMVHDAAGRLHRLVGELQHLARVQAHQLPPDLLPVDPAEVAHAALNPLRLHFAEKGLTVVTNLAPHLPAVWADRDHAIQILSNQLTNALLYTPAAGQVTLTLRRPPGSNEVLFAVSDTGIGIGAEHLPHLFERFFRVDPTGNRRGGGSGIGLPVARALVEGLGGRIWAESPGPGQGSTFSFTLPIAPKG